jgi:hypothetical protein
MKNYSYFIFSATIAGNAWLLSWRKNHFAHQFIACAYFSYFVIFSRICLQNCIKY